VPKCFI
jgi:hypothetical protein